ncbi:MAG: hypothetical protein ACWA44_02200 [Thiotrichales bacterium]
MSQTGLTRMADILPPEPVITVGHSSGIIELLVIALLVGAIAFLSISWRRQRHQQILEAARSGDLDVRAAAHKLSRINKRWPAPLRQELDLLRFAKQPPTVEKLQSLIERAQAHD